MSKEAQEEPAHSRHARLTAHAKNATSIGDDEIDIGALFGTVWAGRWAVSVAVIACVIVGTAYAFFATEWYQAEVVLSPVAKKSLPGGLAQLGGLASLAGIDVPSAQDGEPIAVLKSRSFIRDFIEDQKLMPILFESKWDGRANDWKVSGEARPDIRDGVKYFDERIRVVTEDKKSGLVSLSITWKDGSVAADWANLLVMRLNERLRAQAIQEAQSSIEYLQKEMLAANVVSLQQSIGRVLEGEMQKMALARANQQFAFKVVDNATPPKFRQSPKRLLIVMISMLLGGTLGVLFVLARSSFRKVGSS